MKKILFILALLAMVVLQNVAQAQEPSDCRHLSDGVALVALEGRAGGGGGGVRICQWGHQGNYISKCTPGTEISALKARFNAPTLLQAITEFAVSPLQREVVTFAHCKFFRFSPKSYISLCKKATYTSDKWRSLRGSYFPHSNP